MKTKFFLLCVVVSVFLGLGSFTYKKVFDRRNDVGAEMQQYVTQCEQAIPGEVGPAAVEQAEAIKFWLACEPNLLYQSLQQGEHVGDSTRQKIAELYQTLVSMSGIDSMTDGLVGIALWIFVIGFVPLLCSVAWKFVLSMISDVSKAVRG